MVVKILLLVFFLFEDIFRFSEFVFKTGRNFLRPDKEKISKPGRRGFIRRAGLIVASIPFTSMLYGITIGKYDFRVNKVKLAFDNLPKAFDGFKSSAGFDEIAVAVIDCGGTARVGVYPMKGVFTVEIHALKPSGPLFRFITEELFVSGVGIDQIELLED